MFHLPAHKSGSAGQHVPAIKVECDGCGGYGMNQPMSQFEVFRGMGFIVITVMDTSRWDSFYGFRRVVKLIKQPL